MKPQFKISETDDAKLNRWLGYWPKDWIHRDRLARMIGWPVRRVRLAAEALGAEIVRGPKGYKLTRDLTSEDMPTARAAVAMARNQAKRMSRTANALEAKLNGR